MTHGGRSSKGERERERTDASAVDDGSEIELAPSTGCDRPSTPPPPPIMAARMGNNQSPLLFQCRRIVGLSFSGEAASGRRRRRRGPAGLSFSPPRWIPVVLARPLQSFVPIPRFLSSQSIGWLASCCALSFSRQIMVLAAPPVGGRGIYNLISIAYIVKL